MTIISCPWCEADQPIAALAFAEDSVQDFTCAECGTTVLWVDEQAPSLALAA